MTELATLQNQGRALPPGQATTAPVRPKRRRFPVWLGFLAPNLLGFLGFTLFPVVFCFYMAFTNWSPKHSVPLEFLGLRNFQDLIGVRAIDQPDPLLWLAYVASGLAMLVGIVATLWSNVSNWRGTKLGGAILCALCVTMFGIGIGHGAGQGMYIGAAVGLIVGIGIMLREDGEWTWGKGAIPPLLVAAGIIGLFVLNGRMWSTYELRDARFWDYVYNTLYLMLGIPVSIAGSLALALLLNEDLPTGPRRIKVIGISMCLVLGLLTLWILWGLHWQNAGVLGAILWFMAALGVAFNVVAFRTLFYLPTFTSGVALMILWKALYNPKDGPINVAIKYIGQHMFHVHADADAWLPNWLASTTWAKPALIIMGVWIAIGGTNMLLYLAGLSNVPAELLDAAKVDGAGRWQRFKHVIWPQLAPTTFFIGIVSVIGGLQGGFEQARVMTLGKFDTTTLSYYIYNKAFIDLDLGYAAAISWVLFGAIFIATAINWKFGKNLEVGP